MVNAREEPNQELDSYQFGATTANASKTAVHFCPVCHMLLHITSFGASCVSCKYRMDFDDLGTTGEEIRTKAHIKKEDLFAAVEHEQESQAIVEEECPKCGHNQCSFITMQMRSVDEGQTVFYTCLKCGYRWSVNN
ncbi:DNA-directed RNA polymerase, subunit C11/M/9 [Carpediemonas membranifera]|uniref:DNA-directed RNA polymerase I subunit RPA12 n=1 Tax=Carpediemonas membranifera TaxID=201153 RepID=A0A8J6BAR2_9EUKA|nr:DNA-directed RNA polymerase, subunit C11/M/9 [Carpediemonas membranifera]|eukprot:KAG9397669.1 DNA-directed RNA polymerase, subunit C11/M/9 [Carpediemonas membranifera]